LTWADFLADRGFLADLRAKAAELIKNAEEKAGPDSHAHIAKDQPEEGKNYAGAMQLATKANERVFAPLREIMDDHDVDKAGDGLARQVALVDELIAAPSTSHPLWPEVEQMKAASSETGAKSAAG
jgi:F0F1-type ATP synthase membrane subunit b/b'